MTQADAAWCSCPHNAGLQLKRSATNLQVVLELLKYSCVTHADQAEPSDLGHYIIVLTDASLLVRSLERWSIRLIDLFCQPRVSENKVIFNQTKIRPVKLTDIRKNYHNLTLRYIFQDGGFSSSNQTAQSILRFGLGADWIIEKPRTGPKGNNQGSVIDAPTFGSTVVQLGHARSASEGH